MADRSHCPDPWVIDLRDFGYRSASGRRRRGQQPLAGDIGVGSAVDVSREGGPARGAFEADGLSSAFETSTPAQAIDEAQERLTAQFDDLAGAMESAGFDPRPVTASLINLLDASEAVDSALSSGQVEEANTLGTTELWPAYEVFEAEVAVIRDQSRADVDAVSDSYNGIAQASVFVLAALIPASILLFFWRRTRARERQRSLRADAIRERRLRERKDSFLAAASHHIKTPLAAVVGFSQLLRDRDRHFSAAARKEMTELMAIQANETSYIFDDLMSAARTDLEELEPREEDVDLRKIVEETTESWAKEQRARLTISGNGIALADANLCRQIVRNLLRNAIAYGDEEINVRIEHRLRSVVLVVTDDGEGIPEDMGATIFKPYFSVRQTGLAPSLGLGLSVARQLARAMGGDLSHSRYDKHTEFELSLVRSQAPSATVSNLVIDPEEGKPTLENLVELSRKGPDVVYQPIFEMSSAESTDSRIVGYEGLARFPFGSPEDWFTSAARMGMTTELDLACIRAAVRQFAPPDEIDNAFLALNINDETMASTELPAALKGVNPGQVILELSEAALIKSYTETASAIGVLRDRGIRLAIDDIGAAEIDLWHIHQLDPEMLKIDLSLVRDLHENPKNRALIRGLTAMGSDLGMLVVAEGVEKPEEMEMLLNLGIKLGQGYLLGKPEPLSGRRSRAAS